MERLVFKGHNLLLSTKVSVIYWLAFLKDLIALLTLTLIAQYYWEKLLKYFFKAGLESTECTVIISTLPRLGLKGIEQSALAYWESQSPKEANNMAIHQDPELGEKKFINVTFVPSLLLYFVLEIFHGNLHNSGMRFFTFFIRFHQFPLWFSQNK